jgi:hypothetical protein
VKFVVLFKPSTIGESALKTADTDTNAIKIKIAKPIVL